MADVTGDFYAGDAFIGYGAEFRVGQNDGSPETFTAVPDVNSIVPGDATTGTVDTTHLRSLNRHRERKLTLRDSGPFTLNCNYRPTHGAHMSAGGDGFSGYQVPQAALALGELHGVQLRDRTSGRCGLAGDRHVWARRDHEVPGGRTRHRPEGAGHDRDHAAARLRSRGVVHGERGPRGSIH